MAEAEVIDFPWLSNEDLDPDRVLENAKGRLTRVIIVGWTKEDTEYTNISFADGADALWLLEMGKMKVLDHARKLREERGE